MKNEQLIIPDKQCFLPVNETTGELLYTDIQTFNKLIMTPPKAAWIKTNKYSDNAKYLPIRIVEELLTKIFPFWEVQQVGEPKILGNSVVISVNLRVYNPIINQWLNYAGVGAVPIELEKGSDPTDFTKIKPKALHKNVPAALSFAVNNAAKKIGRIFGSHLNSNETIG